MSYKQLNKFKALSILIVIFILSMTVVYTLNSLFVHTKINMSYIVPLISILLTGVNAYVAYLTARYTHESAKYQKDSIIESKNKNESSQAIKIYAHIIPSLVKSGVNGNKKFKDPCQPLLIGNASNEPIYKIYVISCSNRSNFNKFLNQYKEFSKHKFIQQDSWNYYYVYLRIVMPGTIYKIIKTQGSASGNERPAAMIFFTDSKGNKWVRDVQGNIRELYKTFNVCKFCHINPTDLLSSEIDGHNYKNLSSFYLKHPKNI